MKLTVGLWVDLVAMALIAATFYAAAHGSRDWFIALMMIFALYVPVRLLVAKRGGRG